jgi:subtilisin family serine protease
VLAIAPAPAVLEQARAAGFTVAGEALLAGLDLQIVTLRMPAGLSPRRALRALRRIDPVGVYDFNHLYTRAGDATPASASDGAGSIAVARPPAAAAVKMGLLDGGLHRDHPALGGAVIEHWGCDGARVPSEHGTAVASLLVGQAPGFSGVLPAATLYAADVYCGQATGGNVLTLAAALSWLAAENVAVINVSLVGPPNATLERVIRRLVTLPVLVVAAVGNDGPTAPPLYPAAYAGVIGVTGVDGRQRVLIEAGRGPHVRFAAPGADMLAAAGADAFAAVRGTSFAAPVVAGLLALEVAAAGAEAASSRLAAGATDLGRRGRDDVYGAGLVGERYRVSPGAPADRATSAR